MKAVTMFVADDWSKWEQADECARRDRLLKLIAGVDAILPNHPVDGNDAVGVQHERELVDLFVSEVKKLAAAEYPTFADRIMSATSGNSIGGRVLCDGNSPVYKLWRRWMCINSSGREFGQPNYAR